jgi:hypothetical protein
MSVLQIVFLLWLCWVFCTFLASIWTLESFCQNPHYFRDLGWNCVDSEINLGGNDILIILSLPIRCFQQHFVVFRYYSFNFFLVFRGFFYIQGNAIVSRHLNFFLCILDVLFIFLASLLWLKLLVLCWIEVSNMGSFSGFWFFFLNFFIELLGFELSLTLARQALYHGFWY